MPLRRYRGIFEPADLDLLQRVFDRLCNERHLGKRDKEQREALAQEVVTVFEIGVTNEAELRQALSRHHKTPK